ncbi:MAG: single-stranded DNA-binding protein [bacterium]|nr:single-stranded DNA-binding protein [bacterium]
MASRSLNKVQLIGNLTRDPELKYIQQGNAVCTFGVATNRSWVPSEGQERREETEYHKLVSWGKLAELCSQLLTKGRKVYIEGRLQTRSWETADGQQRSTTEIVVEDMILLDSKKPGTTGGTDDMQDDVTHITPSAPTPTSTTAPAVPPLNDVVAPIKPAREPMDEKINIDDIPF